MPDSLSIAVFSDVICPWCFVGKRRLERALDQLGLRTTATLRWLPFELNPAMPPDGMARALYRAQKFGADKAAGLDQEMTARGLDEGIRFAFERIERTPNTRRAHMLIAHASRRGLGDAAVEALFRAYFEAARDIGREDVLAATGAEIGLDPAAVRAALSDAELRSSVVEIEEEAARLDVTGVPFFILNSAWSVSGAQPTPVWLDILQQGANFPSQVHRG
jgi:predicted DsbA family dithiol-disulfide isomerase